MAPGHDTVRDVEAVIVAGGFGTRLRPLTDRRPKHVLPVAGVPFLDHQIAKLAAAGVRRIVLATSYRSDVFEPTFGDGSSYGVELVYSARANRSALQAPFVMPRITSAQPQMSRSWSSTGTSSPVTTWRRRSAGTHRPMRT
jgi:UTP-glucose-1-phosphate uridylyltransferase